MKYSGQGLGHSNSGHPGRGKNLQHVKKWSFWKSGVFENVEFLENCGFWKIEKFIIFLNLRKSLKWTLWLYGLNLIEEFKLYNLIRPVKNDLDLINTRKCIKSLYSYSTVKNSTLWIFKGHLVFYLNKSFLPISLYSRRF